MQTRRILNARILNADNLPSVIIVQRLFGSCWGDDTRMLMRWTLRENDSRNFPLQVSIADLIFYNNFDPIPEISLYTFQAIYL